MKKNLNKIILVILILAIAVFTMSGCGLFGNSAVDTLNQQQEEQAARIAQLEAQLELLLNSSGEVQGARIDELEAEIGELRNQLMDAGVDTTQSVINSVINSVVAIEVNFRYGGSSSTSVGTGFFIQQGGYLATNSHVITPESTAYSRERINIYMYNGDIHTATVVADFPDIDIAILKADVSVVDAVTIDTSVPKEGSRVIAIGTPTGLSLKFTCTAGIVSAANRTEYTVSTTHEFCIQHDAAINPGNSGGPLFNMAGHVIGINTMGMLDYEALSFAIEVSGVNRVQEGIKRSLLKSQSYTAPTLKIEVTDSILDSVRPLGTFPFTANGVKVVVRKTGASFNVGDIITEIDGETISTRKDFYETILSKDSGDTVSVKYIRNGTTRTASFTV